MYAVALIGSYKHDTEKELALLKDSQKNFIIQLFKESYQVLNINIEGDGQLKEPIKIYIITKITDHDGNDKTEGRYPLRIGRRFAFGLGEPSPNMIMSICYRPRQNDEYSGTLRTSVVQKVVHDGDKIIVTTKNSIYYFQEEKESW